MKKRWLLVSALTCLFWFASSCGLAGGGGNGGKKSYSSCGECCADKGYAASNKCEENELVTECACQEQGGLDEDVCSEVDHHCVDEDFERHEDDGYASCDECCTDNGHDDGICSADDECSCSEDGELAGSCPDSVCMKSDAGS